MLEDLEVDITNTRHPIWEGHWLDFTISRQLIAEDPGIDFAISSLPLEKVSELKTNTKNQHEQPTQETNTETQRNLF